MAQYYEGDRIGRNGRLLLGCSATLFDEQGAKVLLTRRADNQRWCLPGGQVEAGESVAETCVREMWEETGLHVQVVRLLGVYSSPHRLFEYADGNRYHCQWSIVIEIRPFQQDDWYVLLEPGLATCKATDCHLTNTGPQLQVEAINGRFIARRRIDVVILYKYLCNLGVAQSRPSINPGGHAVRDMDDQITPTTANNGP